MFYDSLKLFILLSLSLLFTFFLVEKASAGIADFPYISIPLIATNLLCTRSEDSIKVVPLVSFLNQVTSLSIYNLYHNLDFSQITVFYFLFFSFKYICIHFICIHIRFLCICIDIMMVVWYVL